MTRAKKLSKSMIAVALVVVLVLTMLPVVAGTMNANAQTFDGRKHRLGCWWWNFSDATNATTREQYLGLLEETGVTEIYIEAYTYLCNTSQHATLHTFIQAAQQHGIRTSVMRDDAQLATSAGTSLRYVNELYNGWVAYKNTYPDDWLYGIHFDVEPGGYNATVLQNYLDNLVTNAKNILIDAGVYCEFAVNPAWNGYNGISYNGCTNFYEALAKTLGGGKGMIAIMSYRTTGAKVMSRANERQAVDYAVKYNCDFTYGIETDKVESGVDIHDKSKAYLCEMLDYIYGQMDAKNYPMDAGIAIHHARAYYTYLSGVLPTTSVYVKGGTTASRATYTTRPTTAPTQPPSGKLVSRVLWDGDVDATVTIRNYIGDYDNAEIDAAIRADIAAKGTLAAAEYYDIITTGYAEAGNTDDFYVVAGLLTDDSSEFWGSDSEPGCAIIGKSPSIYKQRLTGTATDKKGNLLAPDLNSTGTKIQYFSDADGFTDKVHLTHIQVVAYRYDGGSTPTTQPTTAPTKSSYTISYNIKEEAPRYNEVNRTDSVAVGAGAAKVVFTLPNVFKGNEKTNEELNAYFDLYANGAPLALSYSFSEVVDQNCDVIASATFRMNSDVTISGEIKHPNHEAFLVAVKGSPVPTTPSSSQTTPSSSQTTPSSSQTTPSSSQTTPSSSQTTPSSSQTVPSQSMTLPTTASKPVIDIIWGDADDDCEITMKDVLTIRKYVANIETYIDLKTADANGDGDVNMKDVLAVRKYMAGLISELGPNAA